MTLLTTANTTDILVRVILIAGLWWVITEGRVDAWLVGLPAVALATLASVNLSAHASPRVSLVGLLGFVFLFLRKSISGGIDVARRTLTPKLNIQPGFRRFRLNLDDPAGRVLLIDCISLLPGTLAANLDADYLEVHMLDSREDPEPDLQRLEQAIARLFRLRLATDHA